MKEERISQIGSSFKKEAHQEENQERFVSFHFPVFHFRIYIPMKTDPLDSRYHVDMPNFQPSDEISGMTQVVILPVRPLLISMSAQDVEFPDFSYVM